MGSKWADSRRLSRDYLLVSFSSDNSRSKVFFIVIVLDLLLNTYCCSFVNCASFIQNVYQGIYTCIIWINYLFVEKRSYLLCFRLVFWPWKYDQRTWSAERCSAFIF